MTMKPALMKALSLGFCFVILASCGSKAASAKLSSYDPAAYPGLLSVIDGDYISFVADGTHIATFRYQGGQSLADYQDQGSPLTLNKEITSIYHACMPV
jgi:hypothetical protein